MTDNEKALRSSGGGHVQIRYSEQPAVVQRNARIAERRDIHPFSTTLPTWRTRATT